MMMTSNVLVFQNVSKKKKDVGNGVNLIVSICYPITYALFVFMQSVYPYPSSKLL